ncbi:MAG: hypothetical protein WBG92_19265 [Thiohalocapsa sp.]
MTHEDELSSALKRLGLTASRPVLVSVGGASGLDPTIAKRLSRLFRDQLMPLLHRFGAAVLDGGTDAGVMALMGQARWAAEPRIPLLGVSARGTVRLPGQSGRAGATLEPNHSHQLLVPGGNWGDEIPWMNAAVKRLSAGHRSVTLVTGGGRVTARDVDASLQNGRPTLLLAGTGGVADALASIRPQQGLVRVVQEEGGWSGLAAELGNLLVGGGLPTRPEPTRPKGRAGQLRPMPPAKNSV